MRHGRCFPPEVILAHPESLPNEPIVYYELKLLNMILRVKTNDNENTK